MTVHSDSDVRARRDASADAASTSSAVASPAASTGTTTRASAVRAPAPEGTSGPPGAAGPAAELTSAGLGIVLVGALLAILDFFIVNVALPTIGDDLNASGGTLELVVAGYGISYAVLLVLGGRLGDTFGRKRMFLTGMAAFTVTSLACGLAPNAGSLLGARIVQGASAAMMVPQVLATIQATTTGGRRNRAMGLFGATAGVAAAAGQVLGGLLVSADIAGSSWRPIFLVNVPVGIVGLVLARRAVPNTRSANPAHLDKVGAVLLAATLVSFLVPVTEGRTLGWPAWAIALLAVCPVLALAFGYTQRRVERAGRVPIVPPSLVRMRSMRRGLIVAVPFFTAFGGFMFVYTVALQQILHFSALRTGLTLLPMAVSFLLASLTTARLLARFGRKIISFGAVLQAVGFIGLIVVTQSQWPHLNAGNMSGFLIIAGFGQGLVMPSLMGVILADVPPERAGIGSGVLVTAQQTSLAVGVGTLGSLFLSVSHPGSLGPQDGFTLVLALVTAVALVVIVGGRMLSPPSPRPVVPPARLPAAAIAED